jgi:hypothetical protein
VNPVYEIAALFLADETTQRSRMEVCLACPDYIESKDRCGICQCVMRFKVKFKGASCPAVVQKWSAVEFRHRRTVHS